jgi:site-specific recombinase XerD
VRTAFGAQAAEELYFWAMEPRSTVVKLRNVLLCLVLYGVGCRISDVRDITWANVLELIQSKETAIFEKKGNLIRRKPFSDHAALLAKPVAALLAKQLDVIGYK